MATVVIMSNGWKPKSIRNNGWTNAYERHQWASQGIFIGAYANRKGDSNAPTPMGMGASARHVMDKSRFASPSTPPTPTQILAFAQSQRPKERYGGGFNPNGVKPEMRGYRDNWLSGRHRNWGVDVPMTDLDMLVTEFDTGKVVALVEYKCGVTDNGYVLPAPNLSQMTYKALADMASRADLFFFVVYYYKGTQTFKVYPANQKALDLASGRTEIVFSEEEWVERLYRIRRREMPDEIRATLNKTK